jgi:hypothetical protein
MKNWPFILWVIFFALVIFIVSIAKVLVSVYIGAGVLWIYVLWAVLFGGWFLFKTYTSRNMHIHHYVIGAAIVSFTCYQSKFLSIVHAVFNGILTEGSTRWGVDPIWDYYVDTDGNWIKTNARV